MNNVEAGLVTKAWDVLERINAAKGSKEKTRILMEAKEDLLVASVLMDFFKYSMDPFITRGVDVNPAEVGDLTCETCDTNEKRWWSQWILLLDMLNARQLTGNKARAEVVSHLRTAGKDIVKWALPMFRCNYTIGLSHTTVDKVFPGLISYFECQLATEWDGKEVPKMAIVEPKYDGIRGLVFADPTRPLVLSRNGKQLNNVGHVLEELLQIMPGYVIDGEFFNSDWSTSISAVRSGERGDTSARFRAFDCMTLSEFKTQKVEESGNLMVRQELLQDVLAKTNAKFTNIVLGTRVETVEEVRRATDAWLAQGYEGGVLKSLLAGYDFSRSNLWLKVKPFKDIDLPIVGYYEGEGRNAGRMGGVIVEEIVEKAFDEAGNTIQPGTYQTRCGGGWSDELREELWKKKEEYLGRIIQVSFQNHTPDGKLRHPNFERFRTDKD